MIHFLTTGGTIDKVYFDATSEYEVGPPHVAEVLREGNATFDHTIEAVLAKDSLDLTDSDRASIRRHVESCPGDRVIITHGTDTMVETARSLSGIPGKTIVLTGAMQPAGFKTSDAEFNLGVAIGAVQALPPGVYIAMNGQIFDPARVRKNRELKRFVPIESATSE
ncbi:MAG TPA: asparaginase domain-containing protein [Chthoniobacter sp.]|jgi:L-asparaginase